MKSSKNTFHQKRRCFFISPVLFIFIFIPYYSIYAQEKNTESQQLLKDIFKELVEINTTSPEGNTTIASEAMAHRLAEAGFPKENIHILTPNPIKGNLVVRYKGNGKKNAILLLAHLDVVKAKKEEWSFDPFKLTESNDYFYGRGTTDDKAMAAIFIANLIRYHKEDFKPDRDIIVCLTSDEENGGPNGIKWLLDKHRDIIDAEFC
ncbi:MAG TPA: M20/M25/M40 family metallo-hydrolase, partial [Draconibacterium sp.]|nr:M20/M25/M40 family metallo-hydrolase [Draconibacterium sp.]